MGGPWLPLLLACAAGSPPEAPAGSPAAQARDALLEAVGPARRLSAAAERIEVDTDKLRPGRLADPPERDAVLGSMRQDLDAARAAAEEIHRALDRAQAELAVAPDAAEVPR